MTQPNYPQYPQQPQYPQSGGYPAQPYPAGPPGYPGMQPKPSGGTAITAGVLAVLGALWALISLVASIVVLSEYGSLLAYSYIGLGLTAIEAVLLLVGGILLFMKKPAGRWMVIVGCALVLLSYALGMVMTAVGTSGLDSSVGGAVVGGAAAGLIIVAVPAIATLVLAAVPPTGRYLRQNAAPQQPMGHPQGPGPQGW
ncbi:hypothetical protein [Amycolatopsis magusensis]|uniref:hypothetical protein n=1 Tax=Amycolatopsis magusensis TaxID=882444 RepID=UPI0037A46865